LISGSCTDGREKADTEDSWNSRKQLVLLKLETQIEVEGLVTSLERKVNQAPRLRWEMARKAIQISGGIQLALNLGS